MTKESRIAGYLGLAARARLCVSGEFATEKAIKSREAKLVILAADASDGTKKKFRDMCEYRQIPVIETADREALGRAVGRAYRASAALTDEKMAEAVMRVLS